MSNPKADKIVHQVLKESQGKVYVPPSLRGYYATMHPGKSGESFNITLDTTWFKKGDILGPDLTWLQILTLPKRLNYKWYHILINKLTFGYLCPMGFSYKVKKAE